MYGLGIVKGMLLTLRHLLRSPITLQYPEQRRDMPERSRNILVWYEERCTGCNTCAEACPDSCIKVVTSFGIGPAGDRVVEEYEIDFRTCMFCALCVEACPYTAIRVGKEYETLTTYNFESMVFDKQALIASRNLIEAGVRGTAALPRERAVASVCP